ncbi:MAG: cation transporter [Verrucomicrobia bacterium]|nr:cation transporter [Verrucomicrobiota bacterium]
MKTILTTLAIGGLLCCASARAADGCCPTAPAKDSKVTLKPASIAAGSTVTLKVTGMTCDKCAAGVQKALKKVDGVKAAEVSLDKEQAVVTVDAAKAKPSNSLRRLTRPAATATPSKRRKRPSQQRSRHRYSVKGNPPDSFAAGARWVRSSWTATKRPRGQGL